MTRYALAFALTAAAFGAAPENFTTSAGMLQLTPIQHASVMIQAGGKVLYVDPAQGSYDGLPQADYILVTDIHGDHLSVPTLNKLKKADTVIVGLSPDKAEAQEKFKTKYGFKYDFVPDPDHAIAEAYGVWKEKSMYGKKYMGIERTTFLVGADGKIAKIFPKVKPEGHAAEVLAAL